MKMAVEKESFRRRKVEGGGRWMGVCGAGSEGERERK